MSRMQRNRSGVRRRSPSPLYVSADVLWKANDQFKRRWVIKQVDYRGWLAPTPPDVMATRRRRSIHTLDGSFRYYSRSQTVGPGIHRRCHVVHASPAAQRWSVRRRNFTPTASNWQPTQLPDPLPFPPRNGCDVLTPAAPSQSDKSDCINLTAVIKKILTSKNTSCFR